MKEDSLAAMNAGRMTSLEIAQVTGKPHNDVLKAIRKMEPAWKKVNGGNFSLVDYCDSKGQLRPCYSLDKTECLFRQLQRFYSPVVVLVSEKRTKRPLRYSRI